ncbi:MAG TPA: hypothetical protein VGG16_09405, partial [Streptosporangiaceae bacterium]
AGLLDEPAGDTPPLTMWWSVSLPDGGGVHMKVEDGLNGWAVTDVYVHAPEVTTTTLREAPLSQLSLIMNLLNGWDPDTIAEANKDMGQRVLSDPQREPSLAMLRRRAEGAPAELPVYKISSRPRLTRPDGSGPEGFYELVGIAYREYAARTRSPAVEIAKEADVPVATARGWIREARRRGKLPEGKKGKAG